MTPVDFLNEFGAVANAPGGVQRLREMILQLAVQGKLVEQNKNEESAEALLIRVLIEKDELVKRKIIGKQIKPSNLLSSEITFSIPENWQWVRFGMICHHNAGKTLDKGRNSGSPKEYITTSNLYWGRFELNQVREMLINDEELTKCQVQRGDLLICEGGEAGRAAVWELEKNICFQNHIHRARFYCDINPYFYFRFFQKLGLSGEINKYRKGVGISSMSGKTLSSIPVPLPPIEEQKRIVAKVDQLMAICDQLEAQQQKRSNLVKHTRISALEALANAQRGEELQTAWKRVEENLSMLFEHPEDVEDLKKCILQNAVMGKLVSQNPDDEPAGELLKKIAKEKAELIKKGEIKRQNPLPEIRDDEKPFEIPVGWDWCRLNDVYDIRDGTHNSPKSQKGNDTFPLITSKDFKNGIVDFSNAKRISKDDYEEIIRRSLVEEEDILFSMIGGNIGNQIMVYGITEFAIKNVALFKYYNKILSPPAFLKLFSENIAYDLQCKASGGAQPFVSLSFLRQLIFALPPLEEQKRIVEKAQSLLSLCDTLQKQLAKSRKVAEQLAQSVVESITGISTEKMVNDLIVEKPGQV